MAPFTQNPGFASDSNACLVQITKHHVQDLFEPGAFYPST